MKEKYIVDALVLVPCKVIVLGEHIGDALDRFQEGAWHKATPDFDHAVSQTAREIRLMKGDEG